MLLYILLILGQAFASQKIADQIYKCAYDFARHTASSSSSKTYTVKEVVDSCIEETGAKGISVKAAKITEGTTHFIRLTWQQDKKELSHDYAFNIQNTKLCNELSLSPVKSFVLSLKDIMDHHENSWGYNFCLDEKNKEDMKYGFGFKLKSREGPCVRICGKNEVLKGTRANILYTDKLTKNTSITNHSVSSSGPFGEVFLDLQCVRCPKGGPDQDASYSKTHPDHNECYNSDGCQEGYEIIRDDSQYEGPAKDSIWGLGKICVPKCAYGEARDLKGICQDNNKKLCEDAKRFAQNPQKWLNRFMAINGTIGKCDMKVIQKMAQDYISFIQKHMSEVIDSRCNNKPGNLSLRLEPSNFTNYVLWNYDDIYSCLDKGSDRNVKFDPTIYNLMNENPITTESNLNFYGNE